MSWLKKLLSNDPNPSPSQHTPQPRPGELLRLEHEREMREKAAAWFADLKPRFGALLRQRAEDLRSLMLPVPAISGELTYTLKNGWLNLTYPTVIVPPHFVVYVRADAPPPENGTYMPPAYLVTGTEEGVQAAARAYEQRGVIALVEECPGVWLNLDPYEMFGCLLHYSPKPGEGGGLSAAQLGERYRDLALDFALGYRRAGPHAGLLPLPAETARKYTPAALRQMERRYSLYNALSAYPLCKSFDGACSFAKRFYRYLPHEEFVKFPNPVLFSDLPEPAFSDSAITLKVLPGEPARSNVAREFLDSLRAISHPVAFELIDDGEAVYFQLVCGGGDRKLVEHQLELHFPSAAIIEQASPPPAVGHFITARPTALNAETRPLSDFPLDPLSQLFSLLNKQARGQAAALQALFFPLPNETAAAITEALRQHSAPDHVKTVARKVPAWQVTLRAFSSNPRALHDLRTAFFGQYATPQHAWAFGEPRRGSFTARDMSEWALLSTAELSAVAHFPTATVECSRLEKASMKAKLPPDLFASGEVRIGTSEARGQVKPVLLPDGVRARHLYVVGKSGSGKSTLITNVAAQDIRRGEGVCVIDPHGDLVSDILDLVPEHRVKDTIYFNVSDRAHPVGLDMMSAGGEAEVEILTDDLITTFRRLTETWGERMETILRYSFNTLLRTPGATFLDVQKLLTNEGWRSTVVRRLDYQPLTDFWFNQYPNMPKDAAQPILSRMTKIVLSPTLNAIFGRSSNTLNFNDVIRNRKILLVNLGGDSRDPDNQQLAVSDEMKKLIGSVVVSQLQLAAMRQASVPEHSRVPCRFFVDEFQNFVSGAFPKILSEARKYKLSLTVAHQYISQLDDATRNAVFGNVGTMVVMPLGQKDAAYLGAELGSYTPEDVANLSPERHEALCRPPTQASDTFLFTTLPPATVVEGHARAVIEHTRAVFGGESEGAAHPAPEAAGVPPVHPLSRVPMRETPKAFASAGEKLQHFVSLAGYLTTQQLIELCYPHLAENSKRPAASRDLKKLTDAKKLKSANWGDGKVFYAGGQCNPTAHNVAVRDVLVRILRSGYEVAEVNLSAGLGALSPDLGITFLCEDGSLLPTYWEYDTGTEGVTEIVKKVARYAPYSPISRVSIVCSTRERLRAIMKVVKEDFVEFAVLDEFTSLISPSFVSASRSDKYAYF